MLQPHADDVAVQAPGEIEPRRMGLDDVWNVVMQHRRQKPVDAHIVGYGIVSGGGSVHGSMIRLTSVGAKLQSPAIDRCPQPPT